MKYKAVILAAGRGSRLAKLTEAVPKALLPLGPREPGSAEGTCFLRRHIDVLNSLGVSDIVVVAGFKHEMVSQAVSAWNPSVKVVVNAEINRGSLYSFHTAVTAFPDFLDGTSNTLVMDADIVYPRKVLEQILTSTVGSVVLVAEKAIQDEEEVRVYGTPDTLVFIGKNPPETCRKNEACIGEATGIVLFTPGDHTAIRRCMKLLLDTEAAAHAQASRAPGNIFPEQVEHEALTQKLIEEGRMRSISFTADIPFTEVDTLEDYRAACEDCYPAVLRMDAS